MIGSGDPRSREFSLTTPCSMKDHGHGRPRGPEHEAEAQKDPKFDKWKWRLHKQLIEQAVKAGYLSIKAEEVAHKFLKNYILKFERTPINYQGHNMEKFIY